MSNSLTEQQIKKFRKRARTYVSGRGRINPKWLDLADLNSDFLDSEGVALTDEQKVELYPFVKDTSIEIKFRILAIQRLCCQLAGDAGDYEIAVNSWLRDLLVSNESLRNKLKIEWEDPVIRITKQFLEEKENESKTSK